MLYAKRYPLPFRLRYTSPEGLLKKKDKNGGQDNDGEKETGRCSRLFKIFSIS
jgi:hypothetical protein